jgi:hypothetical protein
MCHDTTTIVRRCKKEAQSFVETFTAADKALEKFDTLVKEFETLFEDYDTEYRQNGIRQDLHIYKQYIINFKLILNNFSDKSEEKMKLIDLYQKINIESELINDKLAKLLPHWNGTFKV